MREGKTQSASERIRQSLTEGDNFVRVRGWKPLETFRMETLRRRERFGNDYYKRALASCDQNSRLLCS